jgi:poly(A) polymerase
LQKEASDLMKNNPAFCAAYLNSLGNASSAVPPVTALIRDYLELTLSWQDLKKASWDDCRAAFFSARRFILPVNPPKIEMDKAVRAIFAEHGIEIKKTRLYERERKRTPTTDTRPKHPTVKKTGKPSGGP